MSTTESLPASRILIGNVLYREEPYKPPRRIYEYLDNKEKLWVINKSAHEPVFSQDPPSAEKLRLVLETLSDLQHPISDNASQEAHSLNQLFLLKHWKDIRDAIRPSKKSEKIMHHAFAEVDFKNYGRADFIGIASDGSIVIIELGRSQKATQVGRHALGLARIIGTEIPIFPYAAKYEKHDDVNTLILDLGYGALSRSKESPLSSWK